MNNELNVRALPEVELLMALPDSYPSNQRPLIFQANKFYEEYGTYQQFMIDTINEKWSDDMPVLYEIVIFLQDEFMEQYAEQIGFADHPKD